MRDRKSGDSTVVTRITNPFQRGSLWLGLLPFTFFLAHFTHHFSRGVPQHILWLCNLSNLVLATGLFFRLAALIRIATMWLIPGLPLWIIDMSFTGDAPVSTFLSHVGGTAIGLYAMSKVRAQRNMWMHAWLYGFVVQLVCMLFTPADLNVNVSHRIYHGFDRIFQSYTSYWIFNALLAAIVLCFLSFLLNKLFPGHERDRYPQRRSAATSI
jgi:hypothetical protein